MSIGIPVFHNPPQAGHPMYLAHPCRASGRTGYAIFRPNFGVFVCEVCDDDFDPAHMELPLCVACGAGMAWESKTVAVCDRDSGHRIDLANGG